MLGGWLALAAALAALAARAAAADSAEYMECACTSTHFADVSFSLKCWRNSTRGDASNPAGAGIQDQSSRVSCSRGPTPPPRLDYRLVREVGYYKFHPRQATWEDALRTCAREGANLAVVNSEDEAAAMADIFREFPKLNERDWLNDQAWIGATDLKTEGVFLSLSGNTLQEEGWERWERGEPNNEGDGEHCAVFNRDRELTDEPCESKMSFFCERPL